MSGNPTEILALFALLPSSVVSIPLHYRPFHALFFFSKALQTFPHNWSLRIEELDANLEKNVIRKCSQ